MGEYHDRYGITKLIADRAGYRIDDDSLELVDILKLERFLDVMRYQSNTMTQKYEEQLQKFQNTEDQFLRDLTAQKSGLINEVQNLQTNLKQEHEAFLLNVRKQNEILAKKYEDFQKSYTKKIYILLISAFITFLLFLGGFYFTYTTYHLHSFTQSPEGQQILMLYRQGLLKDFVTTYNRLENKR